MRTLIAVTIFYFLFGCACNNTYKPNSADNDFSTDSLTLIQMVHDRENAMKKKDVVTVMAQFSDDATFINANGFYSANKKEIENFHNRLTHMDSIDYYYTAGIVTVRFLDKKNALVYYPWRMDWFHVSDPADTLQQEIGLMTLTVQKRDNKWLWVAITNQHTTDFFEDLTKHKH